jgi:hypothetical protein
MAKLVFGVLMAVVWWMLQALQLDEELAMNTVFEVKRAVNRAAHAAAQQADPEKLELGQITVDPARAEAAALVYLRENLRLDAALKPLPGSFLRDSVRIERFAVIGDEVSFPYTFRLNEFDYEVTFYRPGVVLIVHVTYPRMFGVLDPVEWTIKGAAEMVFA